MPIKITIASKKGYSWKLEADTESLIGKSIGDTLKGAEINPDLAGYEFTIAGATDNAGFAHKPDLEGQQLQRVLLTKGWGMKQKQKGLRRRKTYRGKELSEKTAQVNLIVTKEGSKKLAEVFPDQNKAPEPEPAQETPAEKAAEEIAEVVTEDVKVPSAPETKTAEDKEKAVEEIKEEIKEEVKDVAEKAVESK